MAYDNLGTGDLSQVAFFKGNTNPSINYESWQTNENNFKSWAKSLGFIDAGYSSVNVLNAHYDQNGPCFIYDGNNGYLGFKTLPYSIVKFKAQNYATDLVYKADGDGYIYLKNSGVYGGDDNAPDGTGTQHIIGTQEINLGEQYQATYRLGGVGDSNTFLDYIELTDTSASEDTTTSGVQSYSDSSYQYLTTFGKYHINDKQFKIISYPVNSPIGGAEEGYQFKDKQNYGNGLTDNSKKYEDGTINNDPTIDIIVDGFTKYVGDITVTSISNNSFTYSVGSTSYTKPKNSWQDVYVFERTALYSTPTNSGDDNDYAFHSTNTGVEEGSNVSSHQYHSFVGSYYAMRSDEYNSIAVLAPSKGQLNKDAVFNTSYSTQIKYKKNGETTGHDLNSTLNNLIVTSTKTITIKYPKAYHPAKATGDKGYAIYDFASYMPNYKPDNYYYFTGSYHRPSGYRGLAAEIDTRDHTYVIKAIITYQSFAQLSEDITEEITGTEDYNYYTFQAGNSIKSGTEGCNGGTCAKINYGINFSVKSQGVCDRIITLIDIDNYHRSNSSDAVIGGAGSTAETQYADEIIGDADDTEQWVLLKATGPLYKNGYVLALIDRRKL